MQIVQEKKKFDLFCKIKIYQTTRIHPFHWHENHEICQAINKPCSFRIDGEMINAEPGDIVAISEQTVHRFIIKEDNTDIRVIQFNSNILFGVTDRIYPLKTHISCFEIENLKALIFNDGKIRYKTFVDGKKIKLQKPVEMFDGLPFLSLDEFCMAADCEYEVIGDRIEIKTKI